MAKDKAFQGSLDRVAETRGDYIVKKDHSKSDSAV